MAEDYTTISLWEDFLFDVPTSKWYNPVTWYRWMRHKIKPPKIRLSEDIIFLGWGEIKIDRGLVSKRRRMSRGPTSQKESK